MEQTLSQIAKDSVLDVAKQIVRASEAQLALGHASYSSQLSCETTANFLKSLLDQDIMEAIQGLEENAKRHAQKLGE